MLRCPKCSRIYQSGANRFCTHDGGRLTAIVAHNANCEHSNFSVAEHEPNGDWQPRRQTGRLVLPPQIELAQSGFAQPKSLTGELPSLKPHISENFQSAVLPVTKEPRPTGRLVLPSEIPNSFAPTGDRSINPTGRLRLTPATTSALLDQNVKGRYTVDKLLQQDAQSVTYLAHDRLGEFRQVMIKIWLETFAPEAEETRRFYEERSSLAHLNHPNIARILDSGELTEGNFFVITELPEGLTLREAMQISGELSAARTARIVRQIAQALTEAHSNRLVHRNLKPENVILRNDGGIEQAKVINFGIVGEESDNSDSLAYVAPERLIGNLSSLEGDVFALGVMAFEMLTTKKPFKGATEDELLDSEELGLAVKATNLRLDLQSSVDAVLERALAFDRAERFHHAREFGEALYAALTEHAVYKSTVAQSSVQNEISPVFPAIETQTNLTESPQEIETQAADFARFESAASSNSNSAPVVAVPAQTVIREKAARKNSNWILAAAGLLILASLIGALIYYAVQSNRPTQSPIVVQRSEQTANPALNQAPIQTAQPSVDLRQSPAIPPDFVRFENSRTNLDGKLAENFVPFSLAFPQNWERNPNAGKPGAANFLDVANRAPSGLPLEQLLVSWYQSKGIYQLDRAAFPALAKKLLAVYAKEIPGFRKTSEGTTAFNGREAYEIRFAGKTKDEKGESVEIFGRTLFVPAGRETAKSGLTLTMLATNLSPTISKVADVGEKGELEQILKTFEIGSAIAPQQ